MSEDLTFDEFYASLNDIGNSTFNLGETIEEPGGVIFYMRIINIRADVICSVMTEWVCFRTECSGP
jgi:hypothetical protein